MDEGQKVLGLNFRKSGQIRLQVGSLDLLIETGDFDAPQNVIVIQDGKKLEARADLFEQVAVVVKELREAADARRPYVDGNYAKKVGKKMLCHLHGYQEEHAEVDYRCAACVEADPQREQLIAGAKKYRLENEERARKVREETLAKLKAAATDNLPPSPSPAQA